MGASDLEKALARGAVLIVLMTAAAVALAEEKPKATPSPTAVPPPPGTGAAAPAGKPADPEAPRRALPVATFKGGQITVGDLEDHIAKQNPFMRERYRDRAALAELTRKLVRFELLAAEAERRGYGNDEEVKHAVKQNAVQAFIRTEFDDESSAAALPREALAAYYAEHEAEFVQPATRRASHILAKTRQEAQALIEQAKQMDLRAFRQLAKDNSVDEETKLRGGDLRFFTADGSPRDPRNGQAQVQPAIAKAAFALGEVGDLDTKPVQVEGGFSVVMLTGIRPEMERTLDEVEPLIRQRLWREKRQQAIDARIAALKAKHKPEVHGELVGLVKFDNQPPVAKGNSLPEGFPAAPAAPTE